MRKLHVILLISCLLSFLFYQNASSQIIKTVVGKGYGGFSGDGGSATSAEINSPQGITFDTAGNMYIGDSYNYVVREVDHATRIISTVAGNNALGGGYGGDSGPATSAQMWLPTSVEFDASANMFIYVQDNTGGNDPTVRKVNTSQIISTIAGNYNYPNGFSGDGGQATAAEFQDNNNVTLGINSAGNIYISDLGNGVVREVNHSTGIIKTIAGNYVYGRGYSGDGGQATAAELNAPMGITFDNSGNLYIADFDDNVIRKVTTSGIISTVAGNYLASGYSGDGGPATAGELYGPVDVKINMAGNMFITDQSNYVIREVNIDGNITTVAGNNAKGYGFSGDGGQATSAELNAPCGIKNDANDNLFIADNANNRIREDSCTLTTTAAVSANVSCRGEADGNASATPAKGTSPYTYSWSNGSTSTVSTSKSTGAILSAGTYTVYVTDYFGCFANASVTITQPAAALAITVASHTNILCHGETTGSATANAATGGTSAYTYSWSPGGGTDLAASNLSAGTYTINVTDAHGCTANRVVTITQPTAITIHRDSVAQTSGCNGKAAVTPSGGTSPYTYSWTRGGQTTDTIKGQCGGNYCCVVEDNNGCTQTACITIDVATGTNQLSDVSNQLSVYPDPNNGQFTIQWSVAETQNFTSVQWSVEVYNVLGERVYSQFNIQNPTFNINISDKANGVYLIRIENEDGTLVAQKKMVKTQ